MTIWLLRLTWLSLPLTAGPAAADALGEWSSPTRAVASVLLWGAWSAGLVATLAPRPVALTVLRAVAPLLVVVSALVATDASGAATLAAIATTAVNAALALSHPVALACAAGVAYGTEVRHPLKVPPALLAAPIPIAVLLVGAGLAAGPLLLAAESWAAGALATLVGVPLAALLARSLHTLSRRWAVLVPAGLVIVDPMTLADPVLFTREAVVRLAPVDGTEPADPTAVDLRLGAIVSSLQVETSEPVSVARALTSRRGARVVPTRRVLFAPVRPGALLTLAADRRVPAGGSRPSPRGG
jgi:hypothetical protein